MLELFTLFSAPLFTSFSASSLPSNFALPGAALSPLFFIGMVKANLGLSDGTAKGMEDVCFVDIVDGLVMVKVVDGVRWKTIPGLAGVPTSEKHTSMPVTKQEDEMLLLQEPM